VARPAVGRTGVPSMLIVVGSCMGSPSSAAILAAVVGCSLGGVSHP
jgi:hypothetical protein